MEENESFKSDEVDTVFFTGEEEQFIEDQKPELTEMFSYKQIGSIARYVEPVNGDVSIEEVASMFESNPSLQAVPVEESDHVIGTIDRKSAENATATAWKKLTSGKASSYVGRVNTILFATEFIEKVMQKVSAISKESGVEYFPVFNKRNFLGIVSLEEFLDRIADIREQDLNKAAVIQRNMFPTAEELSGFRYSVKAWNRMANSLGGDIYQSYRINDEESLIGCFDVSGKNVAASLLTMTVGSFFQMLKLMPSRPENPIKIISMLDDFLEKTVPAGNFITGAICYFNVKKNLLVIFNCGHTNVFMFYREPATGDAVRTATIMPELPPFGMGAVRDALTQKSEKHPYLVFALKRGIHIDLYSDGFTDMKDSEGIRFEENKAKEFFKTLYLKQEEDIENSITQAVDKYTEGTMLPDDITVIDIRF